jgi:hypothetical protein
MDSIPGSKRNPKHDNILLRVSKGVMSEMVFPGQRIWNFLVTGLLRHMSAIMRRIEARAFTGKNFLCDPPRNHISCRWFQRYKLEFKSVQELAGPSASPSAKLVEEEILSEECRLLGCYTVWIL